VFILMTQYTAAVLFFKKFNAITVNVLYAAATTTTTTTTCVVKGTVVRYRLNPSNNRQSGQRSDVMSTLMTPVSSLQQQQLTLGAWRGRRSDELP